MAERPVKVRCHGEVKRLRLTQNLNIVREKICRGFEIPADAEITLTMVLKENGAPRPLRNQQTLQANWNNLQELQVTLTLQAQRARVNPDHLLTVVEGRKYRIDAPPSSSSQVVQRCRRELGIMKNIAEFKNMFPRTSSIVGDLYRSVSTLKTSVLVDSNNLASKSKSVVQSLIGAFVKTETAFGGFIELCVTITAALQQLSLHLVNGDHQAAVGALQMLMSKGDKMEKIARELDGSIERSVREIDGAIQIIANEKGRIEREVDSKTREKERTEEDIKQRNQEIDRLERKLREKENEKEKRKTEAAVSAITTEVGAGLSILGVLFPPLLIAGIPTLVGSSVYLGLTIDEILDVRKEISAAKDGKASEERRNEALKQTLSELRGELRKLGPVAACLHEVWGQMVEIKSTVEKMKSFWPGLNYFCTSMMETEQRLAAVMEADESKTPLRHSDAFKSQIVNFLARSVALHEVCQSCHGDVRAALSNLRSYQDRF